MSKQHSTLSKGRNFTIESFDIVAVCGNKVECCFDKVERCFDIVAGVAGALVGMWERHGRYCDYAVDVFSAGCMMSDKEKALTSGDVVELNVGGTVYTTSRLTLSHDQDSILAKWFGCSDSDEPAPARDAQGRYFIDRDGALFRFVLDYLRCGQLVLPESFRERGRLRHEAEFYRLGRMLKQLGGGAALTPNSSGLSLSTAGGADGAEPGFILVGYRGTFQFGRDGLADVKFRKISRILVSGRVSVCREVFGDTLNESRDPDRGTTDRYSARFYLKHSFIEQAFDALQDAGFHMVGACGSGTNSSGEAKPGSDSEENRWNHYNEFAFCRP